MFNKIKKILFSFLFILLSYCFEINTLENKATKGAIIEAVFILQNRLNNVSDHAQKLKETLEESDLIIKELIHEKRLLSRELIDHQNNAQLNNMLKSVDLVDLNDELYKINIIKGLYPQYLKEINIFIQEISNIIFNFGNSWDLTERKIKKAVKRANLITKIVDKRDQILDLIFNVGKYEISNQKQKARLGFRQQKLALLKEKLVTQAQDINLLSEINSSERLVNRIQNTLSNNQIKTNKKKQELHTVRSNLSKLNNKFYLNKLNKDKIFHRNWFLAKIERLQNNIKI